MPGAKRLRYYDGFFTRAEDWRAEQRYHRERRKHHLRSFHTPGVAAGLEVKASNADPREPGQKKPFGIVIYPGSAVDRNGEDLVVEAPIFRDLHDDVPGSGTLEVFVCLKYAETEGHERIEETIDVDVVADRSRMGDAIEVARVELRRGAGRLYDSDINTRNRPRAGSLGAVTRKVLVHPQTDRLRSALHKTEAASRKIQEKFPNVLYVGDARHVALTLQLQLANGSIAYRTAVPMIEILWTLLNGALTELRTKADLSSSDGIEAVAGRLGELRAALEAADSLTLQNPQPLDEISKKLAEVADAVYALSGELHAVVGKDIDASSRTEIVLDGTRSQAAVGGKIQSFRWTVTDASGNPIIPDREGSIAAERAECRIHAGFLKPGQYTATLEVEDDAGHKSSSSQSIRVKDQTPIADPGKSFNAPENEPISLDASLSIDPDGGSIVRYIWEIVESTERKLLGERWEFAQALCRLPRPLPVGKHVFQLIVVDNEETPSAPKQVTVTVKESY